MLVTTIAVNEDEQLYLKQFNSDEFYILIWNQSCVSEVPHTNSLVASLFQW